MSVQDDLGGEETTSVSADYQVVPHIASTEATHAAATKTLTPSTHERIIMSRIDFSYSGTPTNGYITIASNSKTWKIYITAGGAGFFEWKRPRIFDMDQAVVITMADGGAGIVGTFNEQAWSA